MIKIFSINEIVNATNNLLLEAHEDEKKIINNYSSMVNKNNETINPDVKKNLFPEGHISGEIESIILEAENSQIQTKIKEPTKEIGNDNENYVEEFKVNKDELIESMHKTFSKKIKKNTLKLILDLREEIIFLNKNISSLKERKKKEELNNKILKQNVFDLKQIENKLDHHLKRIQAELDSLKNKNEKLNLDYDLLKEQHKDLIEKNILFDESLKWNEDKTFAWLVLSHIEKAIYVRDKLYSFYVNPNVQTAGIVGLSTNFSLDNIKSITKHISQSLKNKGFDQEEIIKLNQKTLIFHAIKVLISVSIRLMLNKIEFKKGHQLRKKMIKEIIYDEDIKLAIKNYKPSKKESFLLPKAINYRSIFFLEFFCNLRAKKIIRMRRSGKV